ncbi:zinc finger, c2h2 type domain containing protein [Entamoeba histolytica HM-3:IMSS]|uniref:RING-type E3 ubiquitin transferase n=2 Tax=Entamoeba histolytica TaxID=5759 RepID=M2SBU7_ENTHI|nr:zinc finger C2H2 type domain containing protein [Entamoeba histolytica KU27]EMS13297.1 zinc finger, c2h2 type domain containing protein [Entamoeba histolytica HM-3:IMSS]
MSREDCVICTDRIIVYSIGECNHPNVCYSCCFRSRVLYNDFTCPLCRHKNPIVIYTKKPMLFKELTKSSPAFQFKEYGVQTNDRDVYKYLKYLLSNTCRYCTSEFSTIEKLNEHYKKIHHVQFCSVCMQYQKSFTCDKQVFTDEELHDHIKEIDPETGVKKHPYCDFCNIPFFDLESLYNHLNTQHESCFICDKSSDHPIYFRDYDELFKHMSTQHYVCEDPNCIAKKYIAFSTAEELTNHRIIYHMKKGEKVILESGVFFTDTPQRGTRYGRRRNNFIPSQFEYHREDTTKIKEEKEEEEHLDLTGSNFPRLGGNTTTNHSEVYQGQITTGRRNQSQKKKRKENKELFPSIGENNNKAKSDMKEAYKQQEKQEIAMKVDLQQKMKDILGGRYDKFVQENEMFKRGDETAAMLLDRFHKYFAGNPDEKEMLAEFINSWPNTKQRNILIQVDNQRNEELAKMKMRDEMFMSAQHWEEEQQKRIKSRVNTQIIPESERKKIIEEDKTKLKRKKKQEKELFPSLGEGRNLPISPKPSSKTWSQIARSTSLEAQKAKKERMDLEKARLDDSKFPKLGSK